MAYANAACAGWVTIFSTGGKFHPVLNFIQLYALTLPARSMRSCSDYGQFCKMAGLSGKCSGDTSSSVVSILSHIKTLRHSKLVRKRKGLCEENMYCILVLPVSALKHIQCRPTTDPNFPLH